MTTYQAITNGEIDQDSPVAQNLITLLRDNPIASAEGADDAPYTDAGWRPYDGTNVGDSSGNYYNASVDTNAGTVETPNFEDEYEYLIRLFDLGTSDFATANIQLLINGSWRTLGTMSSIGSNAFLFGDIFFPNPKGIDTKYHAACSIGGVYDIDAATQYYDGMSFIGAYESSAFTDVTRARLQLTTGNWNNGVMRLFKRSVRQ